MTDASKRTAAAIEAHYQFLAWLVPAVALSIASEAKQSRACGTRLPRTLRALAMTVSSRAKERICGNQAA
jgi:hypothetical protein